MVRVIAGSVAVALCSLVVSVPTPSSAAPGEGEEVIADLIYPRGVAVDADGTVYAAENSYGFITEKPPGGTPEEIYRDPSSDWVEGLSAAGGVVTFATADCCRKPRSKLYQLDDDGRREIADILSFESRRNPDRTQTYGYVGIRSSCRARAPRALAKYRGRVSSYVTGTALDDEITYVADAGANALFSVDGAGRIRTVAVLPVTRVKVTEELRHAEGVPRCAERGWLRTESVPQDVELGADGNLYLTTLPYQNTLFDHGRIYRVSPATGEVNRVMSGLHFPSGLGITPAGTMYIGVGGRSILELPPRGTATTFAEIPHPGDVEFAGGYVYAARSDPGYDGHQANQGAVLRWPASP